MLCYNLLSEEHYISLLFQQDDSFRFTRPPASASASRHLMLDVTPASKSPLTQQKVLGLEPTSPLKDPAKSEAFHYTVTDQQQHTAMTYARRDSIFERPTEQVHLMTKLDK